MTQNAKQILVLDGDQASALAVCRSLARAGYAVTLAGASKQNHFARSNSVLRYRVYPHPLRNESGFCDWLAAYVKHEAPQLVIPVTERTLGAVLGNPELMALPCVARASRESLDQVLDKNRTFTLAERHGVAVPESRLVTRLADLDEALVGAEYPVVLKPAQSVTGSSSERQAHVVEYATSEKQLRKRLTTLLKTTAVILQPVFQGQGVGVEVLAKDGDILYAFQHRRLHEVPLTGGGSSLRVSEDVAPELLEASERLIAALQWTGVAMVEFKWQPDTREYRLMEINGRFWGSLPLAVAAGADFPAMLAAMLLDDQVSGFRDYRRGVYARNLARDLQWHELVLRTRRTAVGEAPGIGRMLRDLLLLLSPKHYFDVQNLGDPIPGLLEIRDLAINYLHRARDILGESWFTLKQRLFWHNGRVSVATRSADSVLFLCYGNINRSAAAEVLFRSRVVDRDIEIRSAGFHEPDNRPMDERMVARMEERGLSCGDLRSTTVTREMLLDSDVIFVMEKRHFDAAAALAPETRERMFLLGGGLASEQAPRAEIADPYNHSDGVYAECATQLEAAIGQLAHTLDKA